MQILFGKFISNYIQDPSNSSSVQSGGESKILQVKAEPNGQIILGAYREKIRELQINIDELHLWVLVEAPNLDDPEWIPIEWDIPMNVCALSDTDFIVIRQDGVEIGPADLFDDEE